MVFDTIMGNPPYQHGATAEPVYHWFMDAAYLSAGKVMLITPARFLFCAGKTPKAWNRKMLDDTHLRVLLHEPDSLEVFPSMDIAGGVAVTLRDASADFGAIGAYYHDTEHKSIADKVLNAPDFESIRKIIYIHTEFDLDAMYADHPEYRQYIGRHGKEKRMSTNIFTSVPVFTEERVSDTDVKIYGIFDGCRTVRYIDCRYVVKADNFYFYKVLLPGVRGHRPKGWMLSKPFIAEPGTGYTQTYIGFGAFETLAEAEAMEKYILSRFCRCMLYTLKSTQQNRSPTWENVPLQDFRSGIDWTLSVPEIDCQLYAKYGLTQTEIDYIESHTREM